MNNNFTIPDNRKDVTNKDFNRKLNQRKAEYKQKNDEKYSELKYNVIKFATCVGAPLAIIFLLISSEMHLDEVNRYCAFYLQSISTLYIGALISKDL